MNNGGMGGFVKDNLELLLQSNFLSKEAFVAVNSQLTEILKLLTSIIKSSKHYEKN
jgi:hypothetical protein